MNTWRRVQPQQHLSVLKPSVDKHQRSQLLLGFFLASAVKTPYNLDFSDETQSFCEKDITSFIKERWLEVTSLCQSTQTREQLLWESIASTNQSLAQRSQLRQREFIWLSSLALLSLSLCSLFVGGFISRHPQFGSIFSISHLQSSFLNGRRKLQKSVEERSPASRQT